MIPGRITRQKLADKYLKRFGFGTCIKDGSLYFIDLKKKQLICEFTSTSSVWLACYGHSFKGFLRALQWQKRKDTEKKSLKISIDNDIEALSSELVDALRYHLDHGGTIS